MLDDSEEILPPSSLVASIGELLASLYEIFNLLSQEKNDLL
jgi:hypothetical protein